MNHKRRLIIVLQVFIYIFSSVGSVVSAKELTAKSVPSSFYVDTALNEVALMYLVEAYHIDGKRYYSLEDVAYALRDTKSKVSVSISDNKAIITLGKQQKKTDTVLQASNGKTSNVAKATVTINGVGRNETAYLIEGKVCMTMEDIAVIYDVLLANGGVNRMKLYAGIQNPANVPTAKKGQITSDWEEGLYGIQLTYAPEFMATVSYGSIDYGATIVCGDYSENPEAKQLFVLRKTRVWGGQQLYAFENVNSYMVMMANLGGKADNIWQADTRLFVYDFILEAGNGGGTTINIDKLTKTYMGTWKNDKKVGIGFCSTKTPTSFNLIRY